MFGKEMGLGVAPVEMIKGRLGRVGKLGERLVLLLTPTTMRSLPVMLCKWRPSEWSTTISMFQWAQLVIFPLLFNLLLCESSTLAHCALCLPDDVTHLEALLDCTANLPHPGLWDLSSVQDPVDLEHHQMPIDSLSQLSQNHPLMREMNKTALSWWKRELWWNFAGYFSGKVLIMFLKSTLQIRCDCFMDSRKSTCEIPWKLATCTA